MTERLGTAVRPIGMTNQRVLGLVALLALLVAGCGDEVGSATTTPTPSESACVRTGAADAPQVRADLDGDGTPENVVYVRNAASDDCRNTLQADLGDGHLVVRLADDVPVTTDDLAAITIPERTGDLVLVRQQHPRGGFQALLFGYADGELAELTVEGKAIFPFIATDVLTTPTAATCRADGFDVVQARAHEPIGVAPAWDVYRTTYTVDGNTVTKGATTEIADNVLDARLQREYGHLVGYDFFDGCRAATD